MPRLGRRDGRGVSGEAVGAGCWESTAEQGAKVQGDAGFSFGQERDGKNNPEEPGAMGWISSRLRYHRALIDVQR